MFPNIEAERVRCGLTRAAMAERLGVSRSTLRNWLQGDTEIPASKLAEMARLFHCSSDYLLGLRDSWVLFAVLGKPGTGGAYSGPGGMRVQEDIFQQALRLLYERRLEQLGLSAAVTVTERKGGQPAGPSP